MKIYSFDQSYGKKISAFQSNFMMVPIVRQQRECSIAYVTLEANNHIGWHQAPCEQILLVLSGEGDVRGDKTDFQKVVPGDAVFWSKGEWHETQSLTGMSAMMIEGESLDLTLFQQRDCVDAP
ncbi:MAG: cupin domain-containing protein [Bacilli bacterium]